MEVPIIKDTESVNDYLRRIEKYKQYIINEKYNILLDFLNSWLKLQNNTKRESLTKFRNISEYNLFRDKKNNTKLLNEYKDKFKKVFDIDVEYNDVKKKVKSKKEESKPEKKVKSKEEKSKPEYDCYKPHYILTIFMSAIKLIDYKFIKIKKGDNNYYSIIQ